MHKILNVIIIAIMILLVSCGSRELVEDVPEQNNIEHYPTQGLMHFMYGEIYRTEGNYVYANLEYRKALEYDTTSTILKAIGESYRRLGKNELAVDYYEKALRVDPKDETAKYNVIDLYMRELRYEEAIPIIRECLEDTPDDTDYLQRLAESHRAVGDHDKALDILDRLILVAPEYPWSYIFAAEIMLEDDRIADAAPYLEKIARKVPADNRLYEFWVRALFESRNIDGMLSALEYWMGKDPETLSPYFLYIDYQYQLNRFDKGDKALKKIETRWEEDPRIPYFQGISEMNKENADSVMFYFERADAMNDPGMDLYVYYSLWFWEKDDLSTAEAIADRAIARMGPTGRWLHMKAMINAQRGQYEKAETLLAQIIEADPGNINAKEDLANIYIDMNEPEKAIALYEELKNALPDNVSILNNYAYALARLDRDLQKAMDMVDQALKTDKSAAYCDTKAWILYRQKKYTKALTWINKAIKYPDAGAEVYYHKGKILTQLGKINEAVSAYETSLAVDPDNTESQKALKEIK